LQCISDELCQVKKKMDEKASSMTDATPLVEIRAAIQRLKKENNVMNIQIGVLDYELSQAIISQTNPHEHGPSDSGESDVGESNEGESDD
jgi:estrogen-related receptor beta like 1